MDFINKLTQLINRVTTVKEDKKLKSELKTKENNLITSNIDNSTNLCECGNEKGDFEHCFECHNKEMKKKNTELMGTKFWKNVELIGKISNCPYCEKRLSDFPDRKKICEFCNEWIFPKTRPDRVRVIVKDHERKEIDELYNRYMDSKNLRDFGFIPKNEKDSLSISTMRNSRFDANDYIKMKDELKKSFGHNPSSNDVVWGIFNKKITKSKSHQERSQIYFSMARFLYEEGKDPFKIRGGQQNLNY